MKTVIWAVIFSVLTGCMMRVIVTESDDQQTPKRTTGAK